MVHHLPYIGGATKSLLNLAKKLDSDGYEVSVLFFLKKGNAYKLFKKNNIKCIYFEKGRVFQHAYGAYIPLINLKFYRPIIAFLRALYSIYPSYKFLKKLNPDILYLNTSLLFPFAIASKFLSIKNIWHIREQIHSGVFGIRKRFLVSIIKHLSDKIIIISKTNKIALGLKNAKLIYNSTSKNNIIPENEIINFKNKYNIRSKKIITFLGGNVRSKGGDIMVSSFSELIDEFDDIILVYAGKFSINNNEKLNVIEKNVREIISTNKKLSEKIIFTGALSDVRPLLKITNILVWPATTPHFSRPLMEGMMMGKIVIGSDFPSTREIIKDNITGFLIKPNSQSVLSKLRYIIRNFDDFNNIGLNARKKAVKLFDASINIEQNIKYIEL